MRDGVGDGVGARVLQVLQLREQRVEDEMRKKAQAAQTERVDARRRRREEKKRAERRRRSRDESESGSDRRRRDDRTTKERRRRRRL